MPDQTYAARLRERAQEARNNFVGPLGAYRVDPRTDFPVKLSPDEVDAIADALEKGAIAAELLRKDSEDNRWNAAVYWHEDFQDFVDTLAALERRAGREEEG